MTTCKDCKAWEWCDKNGTTPYYNREGCVVNVDTSCKCWYPGEEAVPDENTVDHPAHYQDTNECIDVMIAMFGKEVVKNFCMCIAYNYRFRADRKNGEEDIRKAEWYETKVIELGGVDES